MNKKENDKSNNKNYMSKLRKTAEEILKNKKIISADFENRSLQELMHEIQVHQIELEMQNDELKRNQAELEISRNMYSDLYDFAPIGYFTLNVNGIIIKTNLAGANLIGKEKSKITNQPFTKFIEPHYHSTFYKHLNTVLYNRKKERCEIKMIRENGEEVYVHMESLSNDKSNDDKHKYIQTATIDITERKRYEAEIKKSQERYKAVIQDQTELICRFKSSRSITFVNDAYCRFFNINKDRTIGENLEDFLSSNKTESNIPLITEEIKKLSCDKPFIEVEHHINIEDKVKWVRWIIRSICDQDGNIMEYQAVGRDITEQKEAEAKLNQTLKDLENSNKELEKFAQIVSHDLRSPLNTVISYINIIERKYKDLMDQKGNELTGKLRERINGMQVLISDILNYSQVNREETLFKIIDIEEVLEEAMENLKSDIRENKAKITHDTLPKIRGSKTQLTSVFQNLIDNSIKYCGNKAPNIHITAKERDNDWLFSLSDNGMGIDSEYSQKIFLIFHREENKSASPGYGIGLAYCKKIIERHGGKIWFESVVGKGSTFYFTIKK
jgi:PAS domain S-box-containing protein